MTKALQGRQVQLPGGETVPALGLGTWRMGERRGSLAAEVAALKLGLDLGLTLIDTAEMYGEGGAEEVVGNAIAGRRDGVFLVSKAYPHNASRSGIVVACERSLRRLNTDRIDLYLLHWRGDIPLAETLKGFSDLRSAGKIRYWGVSNFDTSDMAELVELPGGGDVAANQVLYNLGRRGIEFDLAPWSRDRAVPLMAYSPLDQGRILKNAALRKVAGRRGATPAQIALAWCLMRPQIMVIPKAAEPAHVREIAAAREVRLTSDDLADLDHAFPPPRAARPLEMI